MILFISWGTAFQQLKALTLKKFFLRSNLPFFTLKFKLSFATLVTSCHLLCQTMFHNQLCPHRA